MKKVESADRTAVLVLGMHRSGTSAITRVLNMLGAEIGDDLVPPGHDNPTGFWEHAEVVRINEQLLKDLGRTWYDMREMPKDWLDSPAGRTASEQAIRLVRSSFDSSRLCAVKDPRMCLTARMWVNAFRAEQFNVACLFVVRDPREVVDSLHRRNDWPRAPLYLMWVQYLLEAVARTQDCRRSMITYDQMLADWRAAVGKVAADLHLAWPAGVDGVGDEIDKFIDPRQQHHRVATAGKKSTEIDSKLPTLVNRLYKECLALAEGKGEWKAIAEQHSDFRKVAELYAAHIDRLLTERWDAEGRAQTARSRLADRASVAAIVQQEGQHSREVLEAILGEIEQTVASHAHEVQAANTSLADRMTEQASATMTLRQEVRQLLETTEARLGQLEQNITNGVRQVLSQACEELSAQSDELRERVEQHQAALHAAEARLQRQNALLNTALLRLEQMAGNHALLNAQGSKLDAHGGKLDAIDAMLRIELQALRQAREHSDVRLAMVKASTSWKLTRPLRWLSIHVLRRPPAET